MKRIKRCYGCGKVMWPWQNIIHTKLVGETHKECASSANIKYQIKKAMLEFKQHLKERALKDLNDEEQ